MFPCLKQRVKQLLHNHHIWIQESLNVSTSDTHGNFLLHRNPHTPYQKNTRYRTSITQKPTRCNLPPLKTTKLSLCRESLPPTGVAKDLSIFRKASWEEGVSLNLGASTHSPLISDMFPKGDNEYFSVNCSFCISLAACSPSLASTEIPGPPETRTSLSATAPRANTAGKPRIPVPTPGKRTLLGQLGEAGTRERWWEGEGAQTHRGRGNRLYPGTPSPDTPYPFFHSPLA